MDSSMKQLERIVTKFYKMHESEPFLAPVDWRGLGLPDYPKIIKKPMDLGTVKNKLKTGRYHSLQDCADDVRLVWKNCMKYNKEDSEIYQVAERLSKKFEDLYAGIETIRPPSLEDRQRFSRDLYRLSPEQLGTLIQTVTKKCPTAMERIDSTDEVELNIDVIDAATFKDVESFVKQCTGDHLPPAKRRRGEKGKKQRH
mmetsp:Transcript_13569/g.19940  ORF Transcript_13569/g.19940 Transcript_13569/m.19940 type:complete len:199 (-) Transcript_13569:198-794(-)|eukprot:CAMPEP_0113939728 /NCGR_PEP_ID=MMETSP1339-20121228/6003_1 /TAXON_ID=94617 /ORGANISM="Fibrocapsa japonica" /LENGTH=198 /DNA_ID=CAMNT_0000943329 /DNA_START=59 /DNA_END=655 /DNA_ORIENTATION=+ /assembly_acc=CAM_ASM_000762